MGIRDRISEKSGLVHHHEAQKPQYTKQIYGILYKLPKNLEWRLKNYRTCFIGEGECLWMLLPEIPKNWEVLVDLNFPLAAGRMQIDVMLISSRKDFHFEVKNLLQN